MTPLAVLLLLALAAGCLGAAAVSAKLRATSRGGLWPAAWAVAAAGGLLVAALALLQLHDGILLRVDHSWQPGRTFTRARARRG